MWRKQVPFWVCAVCLAVRLPAEPPAQLLRQAVGSWLGERDHWAFTQRAVEHTGGTLHERLERYDPSRPGEARWQLLQIDGKPPTPAQRQKWAKQKFKHHAHFKVDPQLADFFDFKDAHLVGQTPTLARFNVPLRRDKNWLFPVDKVAVRVTINKQTHALEHLSANVREPFKVLLGLAHVLGGNVDLNFLPFADGGTGPASAEPRGKATVSVTRFGERIDFTWSNFKRVEPYHGSSSTVRTKLPSESYALAP